MARKRKRHSKKVALNSAPLIDVVVLTHNRFDLLRKALDSLKAQENAPIFRTLLFDNGSDAEERLHYKDLFEGIEHKRSNQNLGFSAGMNEGAKMGKAPLIFFLSDDVELMPDVLEVLSKTMDDADIGMCGMKFLFPKSGNDRTRPAGKVQHVGLAMNIKAQVVHPLVGWDSSHPKCNISRDVIGTTGAAFMIRRNLFNKLGGFYTGYGMGTWEDVDLSFGVRSLGKRVFVNAAAVGYHYVGATAEKMQQGFPLEQNMLLFRSRWATSGLFKWTDWEFYLGEKHGS